MAGFRNESQYRECIVSYLSMIGPRRHIVDIGADGVNGNLGIFHYATHFGDDETGADPDETRVFVNRGRGAGSGKIVRARPVGPESGRALLAAELYDLLHIQLECLAAETMIRGAAVIGLLHVGPNRENPLFGPALSRAREMERGAVDLPLIAFGDEVFGRLKSAKSLRTGNPFLCKQMDFIECTMTMEVAEARCIDYLRASLGDFDYDFDRYLQFLAHHRRFVEAGLAGKSPSGNAATYEWLKLYHNARIDEDLSRPDRDTSADECDRAMAEVLSPLRIA